MVNFNQIQSGLVRYIDNDLLPMVTGWKKWGFGAVASLALANMTEIFNKIKTNDFVRLLGVVDIDDMIDIDKLYRAVYDQAQKGAVTFDLPIVGALTVNKTDLERIYRYIKEG